MAALRSADTGGVVIRTGADQAEGLRTAVEAAVKNTVSESIPSLSTASVSAASVSLASVSPASLSTESLSAASVSAASVSAASVSAASAKARVIAITSGKGGVGKTNVAVNLAIALSQNGARTVVIDADFGLANVEVLFGSAPQSRLHDVIALGRPFAEALNEGLAGVKYVSGGSGVEDAAIAFAEQASALVSGLALIDREFDAVIIDTGAGISEQVIDMALAADEIILVATPEPTSITDAYALVKTLSARDKLKPLHLLLNRAENRKEATDAAARFIDVTARFLDLRIGKLGYILNDPLIVRSVKAQFPFVLGYPKSAPANAVRDVAANLFDGRLRTDAPKGRGIAGFLAGFSRLTNLQYK